MINFFYHQDCTWEYDFIMYDLFHGIELNVISYSTLSLSDITPDIIHNCIVLVHNQFEPYIQILQQMKPLILILCSDEWGNKPYSVELSKFSTLILRQYHHSSYVYPSNSYHLPLGYASSFLSKQISLNSVPIPLSKRKWNCSFIGVQKQDRVHMANLFSQRMEKTMIRFVPNDWKLDQLVVSPSQCHSIYSDSIFVLIGRGWSSINCFRIYEAIVAGAIPVTCASQDEIDISLRFRESVVPVLHDDSWEKLVDRCLQLLDSPSELQIFQERVWKWWKEEILFLQTLVKQTLDENPRSTPPILSDGQSIN